MKQECKFSRLCIAIEENDSVVTYKFEGDVDEHFRQSEVPRINKPTIVFELGGIENFNSVGIREWIYLIRDFSVMGKLVFRGCSVAMVDQINMVPDSKGNATIESIYAPYYCPKHGEVSRLIQIADHQSLLKQKKAPAFHCEQCSSLLEFDALEESYFLFTP